MTKVFSGMKLLRSVRAIALIVAAVYSLQVAVTDYSGTATVRACPHNDCRSFYSPETGLQFYCSVANANPSSARDKRCVGRTDGTGYFTCYTDACSFDVE
jgi:hypothetical protein